MDADTILQAVNAGEDSDWEFKSAKGGFPKNLWETYSAMANTDGGVIVLGVEPKGDNQGEIRDGLADPDKMRKTFWDNLNNRQIVSTCLVTDKEVTVETVSGKSVLVIHVPRADRRQRPVFTGLNPLTGTYRRNFEGDYLCRPEEVGRLLADQAPDPADARVLPRFEIGDLDSESIAQYRNRFSARNTAHAWLSEDIPGFLRKLGAWRKDRDTGEEGVTVAGLLMFGTEDALADKGHGLKYQLDYRERPTNAIADRWTDRVTIDGTWTPNLFQFYLKVYAKLTSGLRLPFAYQSAATTTPSPSLFPDPVRTGQSPVHEAIQEALVNSLIHADYQGQGGIVIERFRDRIELSNPGRLLVSVVQLMRGGVSECRNENLQTMFRMIGAGDEAGSGIDKIRQGWRSQQWRSPSVQPFTDPDRIQFILPMVSLIPPESEARLRKMFGADFETLAPLEVQTLVTADLEGEVSNSRLQLFCQEHPAELTRILQNLTAQGYLEKFGQKRQTYYRLPAWRASVATPPTSNGGPPTAPGTPPTTLGTPPTTPATPPIAAATPPTASATPPTEEEQLLAIAQPAREKPRLAPELTKAIIRRLCSGRHLDAARIADLMRRDAEKMRERFLNPMVAAGELALRYPAVPNHPQQSYTTATTSEVHP